MIGAVRHRALAVGLLLLGWSPNASAQASRTYIGGALTLAPWAPHNVNAGSPSTTFSNTSPESTVTGVAGEAGVFFSRGGSIGAELATPFRRNALTQHLDYASSAYVRTVRYRERSVLVVVRGQLAERGRVQLFAAGGSGVVQGSALDRFARKTLGVDTPGPFGDETEKTKSSIGVIAGADLVLAAAAHLRIVPQVRTLVIPRGDPKKDFGDLGLPRVVLRLGVGVQAVF